MTQLFLDNQGVAHPPVVIYGCAGLGKSVLNALLASGRRVLGFVDDFTNTQLPRLHSIHDHSVLSFEQMLSAQGREAEWIVAIGENGVRKFISQKLQRLDLQFATVVYPSVEMGLGVSIGPGSVVLPGAVIGCDAQLGSHVIVCARAGVDHDTIVGDYAYISPGSTVCGYVNLQPGVFVGAGVVVGPNVEIGRWTSCGAGAVAIKSLPSQCVAYGCPAEVRRQL